MDSDGSNALLYAARAAHQGQAEKRTKAQLIMMVLREEEASYPTRSMK
jgi:hypothetical protein